LEKIEIFDHTNNDDSTEKNDEDNEDLNLTDVPLDPRAGRVDVEIPQLPFNPIDIISLLKEFKFYKLSTTKSRKIINQLITE
jgi:ribosomal RNA-processing protein 1